jgi:serine/threonine-protein kinase
MNAAASPVVGDRIGQYDIVGKLRSGGMGTVYLGQRRGPAGFVRDVVIKLIHPHLVEQERFVEMFMDEARISARINHPNVVQVEELGEDQGRFYLVMERVNGCSFHQLIRQAIRRGERIPMAAAVHIAMKAAMGLHAAHETSDDRGGPLGIVHRDVSPSNILISRDGNVKVIDFGIAKAHGRTVATHASHWPKGKLRYMSPEQAWGWELDRRSDVYSLGVVLWESLTLRALFRADNDLLLLEKVRAPQVPRVSTINADVPLALDLAIAQATACDPEYRPATAGELRGLLAQAVPEAVTFDPEVIGRLVAMASDDAPAIALTLSQELDEEERPTTPNRASGLGPARPRTRPGRRRMALLVAALGGVGAIGIALAGPWQAKRATPPVAEPRPPAATTPPVAPVAPAASAPDESPVTAAPAADDSRPEAPAAAPGDRTEGEDLARDRRGSARRRAPARVKQDQGRTSVSRPAPRTATDQPAGQAEPTAERPQPRHVGQTPMAEDFEEDSTPIIDEAESDDDRTPIAEEFEQ